MDSLSPACVLSNTYTHSQISALPPSVVPFSPWTLISLTVVHYLSQQEMWLHAVQPSWCVCTYLLYWRESPVHRKSYRKMTDISRAPPANVKYVTFAVLKYFFLFHFMCKGSYLEAICRMISICLSIVGNSTFQGPIYGRAPLCS